MVFLEPMDVLTAGRMAVLADPTGAAFAIWQAGAAYVPIDPAHPDEVREAMLETASARAVVSRAGVVARRAGAARPWTPTGDPLDAWAYVIFTSGTTGAPKGVAVDHRALANYAASVVEDLDLVPGARHGFVSALGADLGHTAIFPALVTGGAVVLAGDDEVVDPARFDRFVRDRELDYLKIVPSHLAALVDGGATAVPRRGIVFGGESTPTPWAVDLARRGGCRVWNHYGPTETTVGVMTAAIDVEAPPATATLPLTRAVANSAIWLLDEAGAPVPAGMPGEVWVSGACLARGYVGDEARTRERFVDLPGIGRAYRTGDLARQLADGSILVAGRADRQVKVRGYRVEPGQIEAVLASHPAVRQAVVLPRREGTAITGLQAWAVVGPGTRVDDEEWQWWMAARLPAYMVSSRVMTLAALPLTANGKVDAAALARAAEAAPVRASRGITVRDVMELALARIWSEALGRSSVSRDDDFFALGGHSLLAVRIASRIRDAWGVSLPLATLFTHRTVARLADAVHAALDGVDARPLVPLQPGSRDPLVCFPGAGGSLLYFAPLVTALGPGVAVWGAQPLPEPAPDEVEALAEVDELVLGAAAYDVPTGTEHDGGPTVA
ncbi:MAG: AMP-binding protein, partial [Vicinamibacteria bacterium]